MADVVQAFALTLPAGSGSSNITFEDTPLGISDVAQIDIVFPPGCAGLVGARIEFSANPVYPVGSNGWFVLDDDRVQIPVSSQGNSGQWRLSGYNKDFYPHTVRAYYYYNFVDAGSPSPSSLVSL